MLGQQIDQGRQCLFVARTDERQSRSEPDVSIRVVQESADGRELVDRRADVNLSDRDGATALHWAAYWNDDKTAALLIKAGAKPNAANDLGIVPLALASANGNVAQFGNAAPYGSMAGTSLNAPVVVMAANANASGYWLQGQDGGIFTFGNAEFYGSMGGRHLNAPMVGIAAT